MGMRLVSHDSSVYTDGIRKAISGNFASRNKPLSECCTQVTELSFETTIFCSFKCLTLSKSTIIKRFAITFILTKRKRHCH